MGEILDAISYIADFVGSGIYDFFVEVFTELTIWGVTFYIEAKIFAIGFAWDVAAGLLETLDISRYIQQAWSSLDSQLVSFLTRYRIPEALNLIIQAYLTRFVMGVLNL